MPLIFAIVFIIAIVVSLTESGEKSTQYEAYRDKMWLKVYPMLEAERYREHYKETKDEQKAYEMMIQDMRRDGFVSPAIPFDVIRPYGFNNAYSINCEAFESDVVRARLRYAQRHGPQFGTPKAAYDYIFTEMGEWPKNKNEGRAEFLHYLGYTNIRQAGTYMYYPAYGMCKILRLQETSYYPVNGWYIVEDEKGREHKISFKDPKV